MVRKAPKTPNQIKEIVQKMVKGPLKMTETPTPNGRSETRNQLSDVKEMHLRKLREAIYKKNNIANSQDKPVKAQSARQRLANL